MVKTHLFYNTKMNIPTVYTYLFKKVVSTCVDKEYPNHKFEVNVTFCDNDYIHDQNLIHRNIDRPTDVLSFPFYDFNTPEHMTLLGDILISAERAMAQAVIYGHTFKRELCFLLAHSVLHLLGYDHQTEEKEKIMQAKQEEILTELGVTR